MDCKRKLLQLCENADINVEELILRSFEIYKEKRKSKNAILTDKFINELITIYYELSYQDIHFNNMKKSFVKKYVTNETSIEGVNYLTKHGKEEMNGLAKMYEYMHSDEIENDFNIFTLKELHQKLFSFTPYSEYGGNFRKEFAHLNDSKADLCDWSEIYYRLRDLDSDVLNLRKISKEIKNIKDSQLIMMYLDKCVELKCELIKIHPFSDGNGRTIRCFINKLLEDASLPPVYIKSSERDEYLQVMSKGIELDDYEDIKKFYRYKVCDSIVELDIIERLRNKNSKNLNQEDFQKNKRR